MEYIQTISSPVGTLTVSSDGENITGLWIEGQKHFCRTLDKDAQNQNLPIFEDIRKWLDTYFSGKEPDFLPPLAPKGSPFQRSVWDNLCKIPYGKTASYGDLAEQFESENNGRQMCARAVGGAVGRNPISIIIPCHRVIGKNKNLTGYAGGITVKQKLLELEGIKIPGTTIFRV